MNTIATFMYEAHTRFRRIHATAFATLLCFSLACGMLSALPASAADSPATAITRAQQGIDNADANLFNAAIDVPTVLTRSMDGLMGTIKELISSGAFGDGPVALALSFANMLDESGQGGYVKQFLASETAHFVTLGVSGGYFAGKPNGSVSAGKATLASLLDKLPLGRRVLEPGKVLSQEGDRAVMEATYVDPQAGRYPIKLSLERQGDGWRVVEVLNAKDLLNEAVQHNQK